MLVSPQYTEAVVGCDPSYTELTLIAACHIQTSSAFVCPILPGQDILPAQD